MEVKTKTLWWVSADGQGNMRCGDFESEEKAIADIPAAQKELLAQCATEDEREDILAGKFSVADAT